MYNQFGSSISSGGIAGAGGFGLKFFLGKAFAFRVDVRDSIFQQQLLSEMYGRKGIDEMRAIKRALDPEWKMAPGVLFPRP